MFTRLNARSLNFLRDARPRIRELLFFFCCFGFPAASAVAQETPPASPAEPAKEISLDQIPRDVIQVLDPLFARLRESKQLRSTVKLTVTTSRGEEKTETSEGVFQVASRRPNLLRLNVKFSDESISIFCDGTSLHALLSRNAYVQMEAPEDLSVLATQMPLHLGPQPEPLLWLTLAGSNSKENMLAGLSEVKRIPGSPNGSARIAASTTSGLRWVLDVATDKQPRPLRMEIDLTEMVRQVSDSIAVPENYSFRVEYLFQSWDIDAEIPDSMFEFEAPPGAKRFESITDYIMGETKLLGQPAPGFEATTMAGEKVQVGEGMQQVVVLDFWASWCAPCLESFPGMSALAKEFAPQGVQFYAVNVQESKAAVEKFLESHPLEIPVILDVEGTLASAYAASAIPQTVLIGKDGRVESIHLGFDTKNSPQQLREELQGLLAGKRLYPLEEDSKDAKDGGQAESNPTKGK